MQQLLRKYKLDNGMLNYSTFCKNIDEVFTEGGDAKAVINNSNSRAVGFTHKSIEIHRR
jgi:hypothetical protein